MLSLHRLQNCLVYINTLMMQQVLKPPHWEQGLTAVDLRPITRLIWEHINPYGRFELDMDGVCAQLPYRKRSEVMDFIEHIERDGVRRRCCYCDRPYENRPRPAPRHKCFRLARESNAASLRAGIADAGGSWELCARRRSTRSRLR